MVGTFGSVLAGSTSGLQRIAGDRSAFGGRAWLYRRRICGHYGSMHVYNSNHDTSDLEGTIFSFDSHTFDLVFFGSRNLNVQYSKR